MCRRLRCACWPLVLLLACCRLCPVGGWVQLSASSNASVTARRGHTAVTVDDRWLVVFGGRTVQTQILPSTPAALLNSSACADIGGCHEEAAAGVCSSQCGGANTSGCQCVCATGFSGVNCQLQAVDVWLSSVSTFDMHSAAAGGQWLTADADKAGTVNPVAWPAARYLHSAVLLSARLMFVYGGYSQLCGDFCSDLWQYDMAAAARDGRGRGSWTQLLPADANNTPGK